MFYYYHTLLNYRKHISLTYLLNNCGHTLSSNLLFSGAAGYGNELEDASDSTLLAVNRMTEDFFKTAPDTENEGWSNLGDPNQGKTETAKLPILVNKIRAY